MHYTTATAAHRHGDPVTEDGVVGVAVKQRGVASDQGLGSVAAGFTSQIIGVGEKFAIISKGIVQFYNTTNGRSGGPALAAVKGSTVYMTIATGALTLTGPASATVARFGRVVEVPAQDGRSVPTGMIRVDLDKKDGLL